MSLRTPAPSGEQMTVDALEPGGVLLFIKALHLDDIHLIAVAGVGKGDLVLQVAHEAERLQVAVELPDPGHGHLAQVLNHVAHGHIVGQPHLISHGTEPSLSSKTPHLLSQTSTKTEASSACREPEGDLLGALKQKSVL